MTDTISNDSRNAPLLETGAAVNSAIDYGGDEDVFRIEITEGGRYELFLRGASSNAGTLTLPYFELAGFPDGALFFWRPQYIGNDVFIRAELPPGVYWLTVSGGSFGGEKQTGTYALTFNQVNDAPVANGDKLTGAFADTPFVVSPAALLANDTDRNSRDVLSLYRVEPTGVGGTAAVVNGQVVFTPTAGYQGPASFTYWVSDGKGGLAWATASFTVEPPPVPLPVADAAAGHEDERLAIDVLRNDGGGPLTLAGGSAPEGKGAVSVVDGKLVFDPAGAFDHLAPGQTEVVVLTYTARNGTGATATGTVTVTLTGTNDAPIAVADAARTDENAPLTLDVLGNDRDPDAGQSLTLVEVTGGAKGTALIERGQVRFDPGAAFDHLAAGASETVTLRYRVRDPSGAEATAAVEVTVVGVNDAPVAAADAATGTENQVLLVDVLANDTDVDDGARRVLVSATGPAGKGAVGVVNDRLSFDPGADFDRLPAGVSETVTLTYVMRDEHGAASTAELTLTITGTNDAPVASADAGRAVEDSSVSGDVLVNDRDVDQGAVLTVSGVAFGGVAGAVGSAVAGLYGTLLMGADGRWTYAADADLLDTLEDASGLVEVFTYTVSDGQGGVSTATLEIAVALADDKRTIYGGNGPDRLSGDRDSAGAEDTIFGDTGSDWLSGEAGADTLFGGSGDDFLEGGSGRDTLHGERGADVLDGGAGDDRLLGGHGDDRLTGGAGADRFVFGPSGGVDTVTDFERGVDRIVLDGVAVTSFSQADLDGDGVLDAVLELSQGAVVLMGVGAVADWAGLVG